MYVFYLLHAIAKFDLVENEDDDSFSESAGDREEELDLDDYSSEENKNDQL
jgi:hypothetical protein